MKTGYVVGRVWATKRLSDLPSGALLEIDLEETGGGGTAERLVAFSLEELRAPSHYRPHFGMAQQSFPNVCRGRVEAVVESGIGGDGIDQRLGEQEVVNGVLRGAGDRRRTLNHIGIANRPFVRLLRTHGAADDQGQTGSGGAMNDSDSTPIVVAGVSGCRGGGPECLIDKTFPTEEGTGSGVCRARGD